MIAIIKSWYPIILGAIIGGLIAGYTGLNLWWGLVTGFILGYPMWLYLKANFNKEEIQNKLFNLKWLMLMLLVSSIVWAILSIPAYAKLTSDNPYIELTNIWNICLMFIFASYMTIFVLFGACWITFVLPCIIVLVILIPKSYESVFIYELVPEFIELVKKIKLPLFNKLILASY